MDDARDLVEKKNYEEAVNLYNECLEDFNKEKVQNELKKLPLPESFKRQSRRNNKTGSEKDATQLHPIILSNLCFARLLQAESLLKGIDINKGINSINSIFDNVNKIHIKALENARQLLEIFPLFQHKRQRDEGLPPRIEQVRKAMEVVAIQRTRIFAQLNAREIKNSFARQAFDNLKDDSQEL